MIHIYMKREKERDNITLEISHEYTRKKQIIHIII